MAGEPAGRSVAARAAAAWAGVLVLFLAPRAWGIEAFDGRIQAHGFFEAQIRALDADFAEEIDLAQWYNVFNLELEFDILPDGWGPFDLLQAYVRVEARYDAIYSNGFGLFPSVNTFGNDSQDLPLRLRDAEDDDTAGVFNSDAQARPPGSGITRVPDAGELPPFTLGPDGERVDARDPSPWVYQSLIAQPVLDYQRDANGTPVPDPKNPQLTTDLLYRYQSPKTSEIFLVTQCVDPGTGGACQFADFTFAEFFGPGGRGTLANDPISQTANLVEAFAVCGAEKLATPAPGSTVQCRALPAGITNTSAPARPFPPQPAGGVGPAANQSGPRRGSYNRLLDTGSVQVTDPITGETATLAQLYGDMAFTVGPNGELIPTGGGVSGFGARVQGAAVTNPPFNVLPMDPTNPADPNANIRLTGFNSTCPTNRTDTRDPFATAPGGSAFEFTPAQRQAIIQSGKVGTCPDNRPAILEPQLRRGFPGFDTLFDQEGADNELGVNPDNADPALADRTTPVAVVAARVQTILDDALAAGANPNVVSNKAWFDAEQAALNEYAPIFRGLTLPNDDPASYLLDPVIDWRFTFTKVQGNDGGANNTRILGPWLPKNFFETIATLGDRANPFRARDTPTLIPKFPTAGGAGLPPGTPAQSPRVQGIRYHELDEAVGGIPGGIAYAPDPVDPRLLRLNETLAAINSQRVRLRRDRVANPPLVTPYPSVFLPGPNGPGNFSSEQFFGGDFSGIIPCVNNQLDIRRASPPAGGAFQSQIQGLTFQSGCIPFTNVAVTGGTGELPLRPAPDLSNLLNASLTGSNPARGLYVPNAQLQRLLADSELDDPQFNINQIERSWNRGASQSDTYEVKEAYADMEFLDSRLWIRAGLQNIVWGKTELFRTTDQFNPQDLALASLPALEESRIALLSARAVYSLYQVGPLEDVRIELAANFDRFKPADLGSCGEPYTIDIVCSLTTGLAFHGITGIGIAGVDRPPNPWDDVDGIEFGGRVEFRWDRFSFAIVDFYGFNDFPYPDAFFFYERNVDTTTGRPRLAGAQSPCEDAGAFLDTDPSLPPLPARLRTFHGGNPRLAGEVDFASRKATIGPSGDPTARPSGAETETPRDDWSRQPVAYTIQGIGINPGCLKPGGAAGFPNENRFDPSLAPDQPLVRLPTGGIDSNGDGVADHLIYGDAEEIDPLGLRFATSTLGQWESTGSSADEALNFHPANQQLFALICLGTVSIAASLDPGACAWTIFGTNRALSAGVVTVPLSETIGFLFAGEPGLPSPELTRALVANTKGGGEGEFANLLPWVSLNRDARDGLTGATNARVTGTTPLRPGDLDDLLTLGNTLSVQQQALLGCGPFFGTRCDSGRQFTNGIDGTITGGILRTPIPGIGGPATPIFSGRAGGGIDFMNAEASAVLQSFPGIEGTNLQGTTTRLERRSATSGPGGSNELSDAERVDCFERGLDPDDPSQCSVIRRLGDGSVDLRQAPYNVDPSFLSADGTRFAIPQPYLDLQETIDDLKVDLAALQDDLALLNDNPACDTGAPTLNPATCGLKQYTDRDQAMGLSAQEQTDFDTLSTNTKTSLQIQINQTTNQIDANETQLDGRTRTILASFTEGGDRGLFGLPIQQRDPVTGKPIEVPLAGAVVDGLEELGPITANVTWGNGPQPGTLGNPGVVVDGAVVEAPNPFFGGEYCTRVDPASPFADENGIVRLPGCRGALSLSVNVGDPVANGDETIDVVFDDFYDPRVDGCMFGPTFTQRGETGSAATYTVRAVNADGSPDAQTQAILDQTCFNVDNDGVVVGAGGVPVLDAFGNPQLILNNGVTAFSASTHRREDDPLQRYNLGTVAVPQAYAATLFHPYAGCEHSSTLAGGPTTRIPFARPGVETTPVTRGRPWGVTAGAPGSTFTAGDRFFTDVDADGSFDVDAEVKGRVPDGEAISESAGARAELLCDVRLRDYENDFLEGALGEDFNGDFLVAQGAQVFRNEMAAVSFNFMQFLTVTSCNSATGNDVTDDLDCYRPSTPWALGRCSLAQPQYCRNVKGFFGVGGLRRNDVRAGGNGTFGRRDFIWHSGGALTLQYARRNVFGISMDFAEDVTKTNWSMEFTWIGKVPFLDNNAFDNTTSSDALNLTVSVDRPTFINFLNANRTFFMNSQWFFQYIPDYSSSFTSTGPFNVLFTFAVFTGYYQDRLLPTVVTVYDFRSQSGGFLPQITYRFNEAFSLTFGVSFFIGRNERVVMPVQGFAPTSNRNGPTAYKDGNENLLSLIRHRDEAFMRIRWTF